VAEYLDPLGLISNEGQAPATTASGGRVVVRGEQPTTTHDVQMLQQGVDPPIVGEDGAQYVEFEGKQFRIAGSVGLMPLLKFSHFATKGIDSGDPQGLAAIYSMLRDCIVEREPKVPHLSEDRNEEQERAWKRWQDSLEEWQRFEEHAIEVKAEGDDLMPVVSRTIEVLSARPRTRPGSSSAGPRNTSTGSKDSSGNGRGPDADELAGLISVTELAR
jgi:hypothetical protein